MKYEPLKLKDVFEFDAYRMTSGQAEAVSRKYIMYVGKSGWAWFVADQEAKADNIYCTNSENWDVAGNGFGGSTLFLEVINWEENKLKSENFALRGGWHSNADALFDDTGVDVRNEHLTFGAISLTKDRKSGSMLWG